MGFEPSTQQQDVIGSQKKNDFQLADAKIWPSKFFLAEGFSLSTTHKVAPPSTGHQKQEQTRKRFPVFFYLLGFTGFYWVLLGFTRFYWVLLGFTGFYWVLLGFTGFYWVFVLYGM